MNKRQYPGQTNDESPEAAMVDCQHDHMKPAPTLRPTYARHDHRGGWVQEYRCTVCQGRFELPMATAYGAQASGDCDAKV